MTNTATVNRNAHGLMSKLFNGLYNAERLNISQTPYLELIRDASETYCPAIYRHVLPKMSRTGLFTYVQLVREIWMKQETIMDSEVAE